MVLAIDPAEESLDCRLNGVVDPHGDRFPARRLDHAGGFLDGLGSIVRRGITANTAAGAIHRRAGFAEGARDAASGSARGAGDDGDLSRQTLFLQSGHFILEQDMLVQGLRGV